MLSNANSGEQNGRQPPLPSQLSTQRPLQDPPRFGNQNVAATPGTGAKDICRDFLWGTCTKTTQCKYRHELDFEEMKKVLRFCHDHQNRSGCIREDCTYLHVTKEEESLFLTSGQLPRVLAERHTNMIAATNTAETIPQIALFIKESFVKAPPPPPPPLPPVSGASPRAGAAAAPPPPPPPPPASASPAITMPSVVKAIMVPSKLMPNPPPPTNGTKNPGTGVFAPVTPPVHTGLQVVHPMNLPPPTLPPMFDASVPPPPLPTTIQAKSGAVKRRTPIVTEAGPSKINKPEDFRVEDEQCSNCLQLQLRIDACRNEVQQLDIEEEVQKFLFQKKTKEYENMKMILRTLVRPEVCRVLEEHIEGAPQIQLQNILSEINQASSVSTGAPQIQLQNILSEMNHASSVSTGAPQIQLQNILSEINQASSVSTNLLSVMMMFFEYLIKNSRSVNTPVPSIRTDDARLQSVANLTRNLSIPSSQSSVFDALTGFIRNSSTNNAQHPSKIDLKLNPTMNTNRMNGFSRFNGQKESFARVPDVDHQRLRAPVPTAQSHAPAFPDFSTAPPPMRLYNNQNFTVPNNNNNTNFYQHYRSSNPAYGIRGSIAATEGITNISNKDASPHFMGTRYPAPPQ